MPYLTPTLYEPALKAGLYRHDISPYICQITDRLINTANNSSPATDVVRVRLSRDLLNTVHFLSHSADCFV